MTPAQIFAALSPLVANRVYPNGGAPQAPTKPYIVYTRVSSTPENTLSSGVPIEQARLQIDIYDVDYASKNTLADEVKPAIAAAFPQSVLKLEIPDLYDTDAKLFRAMQDYSIWG